MTYSARNHNLLLITDLMHGSFQIQEVVQHQIGIDSFWHQILQHQRNEGGIDLATFGGRLQETRQSKEYAQKIGVWNVISSHVRPRHVRLNPRSNPLHYMLIHCSTKHLLFLGRNDLVLLDGTFCDNSLNDGVCTCLHEAQDHDIVSGGFSSNID